VARSRRFPDVGADLSGQRLDRRSVIVSTAALAAVIGIGTQAPARADSWPSKPVRLIVPFAAGGVADIIARLLADKLDARLGQRVVVENKPGAGGSIGTEFVAHAPADGYTLVLASPGFTVNPTLQKNVTWDPVRDFMPVTMLATIPNVIVVAAGHRAKSVKDLVEMAKAAPDTLTFGSAGIASSNHLAGELLCSMANVKMVHVPYRGQSEALQDVLNGRLDWMAVTLALAKPHIEAGTLRALAVTTADRSRFVPALPTVAETFPGFEVSPWMALYLPARTEASIANRLNHEIRDLLSTPEVAQRLEQLGAEPKPSTPEALGEFTREDREKWARIIRQANITIN
jgi:tripartite-type tricarboxylate transporter receptor subunit TctC